MYKPIPSGPITLERYIEKMKPIIPVVILDAVNKNEFLKKLSFPTAYLSLLRITIKHILKIREISQQEGLLL